MFMCEATDAGNGTGLAVHKSIEDGTGRGCMLHTSLEYLESKGKLYLFIDFHVKL